MSVKYKPVISVLMPAYNAGKYIADAIDSVLQQTYPEFELLIIDDGSTDNTRKIISTVCDSRIVYISQSNQGVAAALNRALRLARGKYIARLDADDIAHPLRLEKQLRFLELNPSYVLVGSDAEYLLENGEYLFDFTCIAHTHEAILKKLYVYCPFIHSAVMYRKQAVEAAGGYSLHAHNFEDYLLWTQLQHHGRFCNLPEKLVRIRFNCDSVTIDEKWRSKRFRKLKRKIILEGTITEQEGEELRQLLQMQDTWPIKTAAYHALCAKKFLTGNYQPSRAREHIIHSIRTRPLRLDNYAVYAASFLPFAFLKWVQQKTFVRL